MKAYGGSEGGNDMFEIFYKEDYEVSNVSKTVYSTFYIEVNNQIFPGREWTDFPLIVLQLWCTNILSSAEVFSLYFYDGPYYIECRRNDKIITMDFIHESDIKEILEHYIIEERELVEKIIKIANVIMISIKNHCIKGGKDLKKLEKIISKFK